MTLQHVPPPKLYNVPLWNSVTRVQGFYVAMTLEEMKVLVSYLNKLIDKIEFENYMTECAAFEAKPK